MNLDSVTQFKKLPIIGLILTSLLSITTNAEVATIRHAQTSQDAKEALVLDILKLALSKSDSGKTYVYQERDEYATEGRLTSWVDDGEVDVMWAGTQKKYEENLRPIRIPIFKGMLGHRIFIIREGDQAMFDKVKSFDELKKIPLGQGRFWGDTAVLKNADMSVVDPVKYSSLFPMLEGGRFDFFPRAIHEPWAEVEKHRDLNLTVEKNILLVYPFAMYFFVKPDREELAQEIERGFMAAIEDGSYDQLFFSNPEIKTTLEKADLANRKVYRLPNPNMSEETPLDNEALWLKLEDLKS